MRAGKLSKVHPQNHFQYCINDIGNSACCIIWPGIILSSCSDFPGIPWLWIPGQRRFKLIPEFSPKCLYFLELQNPCIIPNFPGILSLRISWAACANKFDFSSNFADAETCINERLVLFRNTVTIHLYLAQTQRNIYSNVHMYTA